LRGKAQNLYLSRNKKIRKSFKRGLRVGSFNHFKMRSAVVIFAVLNAFASAENAVPSFNYNDLLNDINGLTSRNDVVSNVAEASKNVGAFLIKNFPGQEEYFEALKQLESGASECFGSSDKIVSLKVSPAVIRSTSAVASADPSTSHPACISSSADVIKRSMDAVGNIVHQVTF